MTEEVPSGAAGTDPDDEQRVVITILEGEEVARHAAAHKADHDRIIVMSDSRNPDGPKLYFTPAEWDAFVAGVKDGEFDDLA